MRALSLLLLASHVVSCVGPNHEVEIPFSIMTFNVRHRNEAPGSPSRDKYPWDERSPELLKVILTQAPDILALQELNDRSWVGPKPAHDSVQSLFLEGLCTEGYAVYMNSADPSLYVNDCVSQGTEVVTRTPKAIFFRRSKFRCLKSGSLRLPGEVIDGSPVNRYASWVILQSLDTSGPTKYFVLNTHLATGDETPRISAVTEIIEVVKSHSKGMPVILTGDLNSNPDSNPVRLLQERLGIKDSYSGSDVTVNAWGKPSRRIDFILLSDSLEVKDSGVVPFTGIAASDHFPVQTTVSH
jgi:endonuclease/exonuclease/phosphatase family metal-dependent hydrolase